MCLTQLNIIWYNIFELICRKEKLVNMDELKLDAALDIMNRKIAQFIRNNKEHNIDIFKEQLKKLIEEEEKIYDLDDETINKVFTVYLKEIKKESK